MLTSLVYRHGAGGGRATGDSVANGQCMVFRRDDALREGWCDEVRNSTVEDVELVRSLVRRGRPVEMFDGSSLLAVRMFEDFADTWRGWGRSLALTGADTRLRQSLDLVMTALALVAPPVLVSAGVATPATFVLLVIRLGTLVGTARAYERRGPGYWLSPLADLPAWLAVARGVVARTHQWRNRTYG
jgi:dolichol-phosphate mannosyltransferase